MSALRLLLIVSVVVIAYFVIVQPRQLRKYGRKLRTVAYIYVAVVLFSAFLRAVGWYPGL